jgi:hypothetical protein
VPSWNQSLSRRCSLLLTFQNRPLADSNTGEASYVFSCWEFKTNAEAIGHCREIAQHFRDESLRYDQDLEISVVNASGREIHREFVQRE